VPEQLRLQQLLAGAVFADQQRAGVAGGVGMLSI
jgi:hypothetical protein